MKRSVERILANCGGEEAVGNSSIGKRAPSIGDKRMSTAQYPTIGGKVRRSASQFQYAIIAAVVMSICPLRTLAQDHDHAMTMQQQLTPDQKRQQGALLQRVREATERFQDVGEAVYEHYSLTFGCVSGPDQG